jgi:hypothetical protein
MAPRLQFGELGEYSMARRYYLLLSIIMLAIAACAEPNGTAKDPTAMPDPNSPPTGSEERPIEELIGPDPKLQHANGWSQITILGNWAKTTVSIAAHFKTGRNACGKEAYGPIEFEDWNGLAQYANITITQPLGEKENCFPAPDEKRYSGGLQVDIKTDNGVISLFEMRDYDICTNIVNPTVYQPLFQYIDRIIVAADKEDCLRGWEP